MVRVEKVAFALILAGFALATLAVVYLAGTGAVGGVVGCIFIPVPICVGAGELAPPLFVASILLTLALLVVTFLIWRTWAKELKEQVGAGAMGDARL